ncbi:hypothetical protein LCI18_001550 [Fusarium solani-melongenae]|uniref:Uncharacterized protein n=1 Tax=Fusarium solani subsp. cucurbitae TaxID=2747967 RepID=A0ACD3YNX5_FUSSC|nr:hypothetical protein LCI18_001550 [Fusarium solani-melongenae]
MPVQKSDVLTIPGEGEWRITPIAWKQNMREKKEDYRCIEFTNTRTDEIEETNFLFVSEELLDKFKSSKIERTGTGFKLMVDNDYLQATEITAKLGYGDARVISQTIAGVIGDKLHDFDRD